MNITMNDNFTELAPRYDARASFYGKAHVIDNPEPAKNEEYTKLLRSYETVVCAITASGKAKVFGLYSTTTTRHIKEFLKQNGFKADTSKQIMKDYGEEVTQ
jgi:hypothetical protein